MSDQSKPKDFKFLSLFTVLFVTFLLTSNIIASKVVNYGWFLGSGAIMLFPISYIINDILTEVYGYAEARKIVWYGFIANIVASAVFMITVALPYPPFWQNQEAFSIVLGAVPRVVIFSLLGYWVGSFANAYVLARMKPWMRKWDPTDKFLFVRTIGSTIVGEGLDSMIFIPGVFIGILPFEAVITMVFIQWGVKTAVEIFATPVTYIVVNKVKKLEGVDVTGAETYNPFSIKE